MSWLKQFVALFSSAQAVEQVEQIAVKPKRSARPQKPAPLNSKRKPKAVLLTTQEASPKPVKKSAQAEHGQSGKSKTPVRQTRQAAKSAPKRKV